MCRCELSVLSLARRSAHSAAASERGCRAVWQLLVALEPELTPRRSQLMYIAKKRYAIERLPDQAIG